MPCHSDPFAAAFSGEKGEESAVPSAATAHARGPPGLTHRVRAFSNGAGRLAPSRPRCQQRQGWAKEGVPLSAQVYVIGTHHPRVPASFALLDAFPSPCVFSTTFPARPLTPSPPATCRPPTIALRWFSEFSEISTVFRQNCSNVPTGTLAQTMFRPSPPSSTC
jgi:hypothetical protein